MLASDMILELPMHLNAHSYYGFPTDVGTSGFRTGGALPVELSHGGPGVIRRLARSAISGQAIGVEQRWILYQADSATEVSSKSSMRRIPGAGRKGSSRQPTAQAQSSRLPN